MALAHNGNLVNAAEIRRQFELNGAIFHGTSDTEAIAYLIVRERLNTSSTEEAVERAMPFIKGAYSCILMTATKMIAFRDPNGFRPLCIGQTHDGAYVVSSESCALDSVGADFVRDVEPGEIVVIDPEGLRSIKTHCSTTRNICIFEYIYFARPDSVIDGVSVHAARLRAGRLLAKHSPVDADIVIGVPDSYKMQKVKAFVTLKSGYAPSDEVKESIMAHCRKHLAKYELPYDIEFRNEMPKTLVGKVAYRQLEEEELAKIKAQEETK